MKAEKIKITVGKHKRILKPNSVVLLDSKTLGLRLNVKNTTSELTIIDAEDYDRVKMFRWCNSKNYVSSNSMGTGLNVTLHRLILSFPVEMQVDHINGDPRDNRKTNLRACSQHQNVTNKSKTKNKTSSKYKGVYKTKQGKFRAHIMKNNKTISLGEFYNEIDAAEAYNEAAVLYHGVYSKQNITDKDS